MTTEFKYPEGAQSGKAIQAVDFETTATISSDANMHDGSGVAITSTLVGSNRCIDVNSHGHVTVQSELGYYLNIRSTGEADINIQKYGGTATGTANAIHVQPGTGAEFTKGKTGDTTYQVPRLDASTHALEIIDYSHHEIHSGNHYFYTDKVTVASAATQDYLLTVADTTKWPHLLFQVSGSAITQVDLYEATDKTGSAAQTVYNSNRNSSNTAGMTVHKGVTGGTTDGTVIWTRKSGSSAGSSRVGIETTRDGELILKQNTKYIIRITSGTADNLTNIQLEWYEHTDKTA